MAKIVQVDKPGSVFGIPFEFPLKSRSVSGKIMYVTVANKQGRLGFTNKQFSE